MTPQDRRPFLAARIALMASLRAWLSGQGFAEIDPPQRVPSPGGEVHLSAYRLDDGTFLHTSPEFAMKVLLAEGWPRIASLAHVWRAGEEGPLHLPEFTMLEWYRADAPYETVQDDALTVCRLAAQAAGRDRLTWRDRACDPFADPERLTVADAFARFAGLDLTATLNPDGSGDARRLQAAAAATGFSAPADETWTDLFSRLLTARVEPRLGLERPTLLLEYPMEEAALARPLARDPRFAERFELYACGVELANGYGELTDAAEQRRRFEAAMAERERRTGARWPLPRALLAAMPDMPECSGCAIGLDRLLTLATGAARIADVVW